MKIAGLYAKFLKAIDQGKIKPQLVKGRKNAMYLESEIVQINTSKVAIYK
jgi:hypothetical protein